MRRATTKKPSSNSNNTARAFEDSKSPTTSQHVTSGKTIVEEDDTPLGGVQPDTWNNIPFPLVDTIKILMEEIRGINQRSTNTNFMVKKLDQKMCLGAKEASAENKGTFDEIRRMELSLKAFVEG
jgi:hypothetical protein